MWLAGLAVSVTTTASNAPYPASSVITASWDLSSLATLRKAPGSDIWPVTWGADGNVYSAWGDGGGFAGTNSVGRVSLGFARISGTPADGDAGSFLGTNVWGAAPQYAENPATFGGKVDELISVGGVLYGVGGLWTADNCSCDPTQQSGAGPLRKLTWSSDLGKSWQIAPWNSSIDPGTFLQFGRDYQGAWDAAHVYLYYQGDVNADPTHIYLRRIAVSNMTEDPATPGHFEYFAGTDSTGAALWTPTQGNAQAIFQDANVAAGTYSVSGAVYDAPLGRYLLVTFHGEGTGQLGVFEAPDPWGPWATVDYEDDWGGLNETAGPGNGLQFPAKWISDDGRTLWAVFSGVGTFDSFNLAALKLSTSNSIPQITAPASNSMLSPGATVTATGTGDTLSWSVAYVGGAGIATGGGSALTFIVPADAQPNQLIRITLTDSVGQIYRDFAVGNATLSPAATPAFTPVPGSYSSAQSVTITDSTAGATIYFTLDGSTPSTGSTVYSTPINVTATQTINAIAAASGYTTSAMGSATYTISIPATATPTFSPAAGTFSSAQSVQLSDSSPGATIYYTTDGSTPTAASPVYSAPISVNTTETLRAIATATGYTTSGVGSASYTISLPSAASPSFSPTAGTYGAAQSVRISDATPGSTIYYTTDGSTPSPTSSAVYSAPLTVSSTETLKAVATASGYNDSALATATYTISVPTSATPTFSPAAGVYSSAQSVTLTDSTPGAVIHYTTNGSTPTPSSPVYSAAINVSSSETLKALAVATGNNNSAVASALYTINSGTAPLVNYSTGFPSSAGLSLVKASVKSNALVLTDGGHSEARAAWYGTPVNVQSFSTSFTFQLTAGSNIADGFTFTLQNARGGAGSVGALGGSLGYAGIAASVAVKFDLYNNAGEGSNCTGFYTKGATPEKPALDMTSSGVNLHSGDVFLVRLTYDGATLRMNITDTKTSASFAASTAINLPAIVGAKSAYVGFTAGTGGLGATQKILTWTYSVP